MTSEIQRVILRNILLILILALVLQGCATVAMKTVNDSNGMGHPFAGTRAYADGIGCALVRFPYFLPFFVVDFPLSLAADILLLPADLVVEPKGPLNFGHCS